MRPVTVTPATYDREIASAVAQHTNSAFEQAAQALTWGADEHILIAAAVAFWLLSRGGSEQTRTAGTHLLATSVVTGILPHALKHVFNQRRPDRLTAIGHLHGVPISGRPNDAFPSGHAVHMGALAGAASAFPTPYRELTWSAAIGLSMTRIVVLAHWSSDVVAGFVGGLLVERLVRRWTGYSAGRGSHD
ncbi:MAG: phosphatase PAP2 family protein [Pseudomonadota bacterium]